MWSYFCFALPINWLPAIEWNETTITRRRRREKSHRYSCLRRIHETWQFIEVITYLRQESTKPEHEFAAFSKTGQIEGQFYSILVSVKLMYQYNIKCADDKKSAITNSIYLWMRNEILFGEREKAMVNLHDFHEIWS